MEKHHEYIEDEEDDDFYETEVNQSQNPGTKFVEYVTRGLFAYHRNSELSMYTKRIR